MCVCREKDIYTQHENIIFMMKSDRLNEVEYRILCKNDLHDLYDTRVVELKVKLKVEM